MEPLRRQGDRDRTAAPGALPLEDEDISVEAEKQFKRSGIAIRTDAVVQRITPLASGVEVAVACGDDVETIIVQTVLISIGFRVNAENFGLASVGIATTGGSMEVDERMRTSIPHIYAIGDVTGKMMGLAHVASAQGTIAAEVIAGRPTRSLIYADIPRCTYAQLEVASIGLTENRPVNRVMRSMSPNAPLLPTAGHSPWTTTAVL